MAGDTATSTAPKARATSSAPKARADDAKTYWLAEGWAPGGFIKEVDFESNSRGLDPMFEGIRIVDCDTHFTEPADLFEANAPAHIKDKLPRIRRVDGLDRWFVGDRDFGSIGGNVIAKDKNKLLGRLAFQNFDQITPASYMVKPRLEAMDAMGIWAQICFQNGGLTQAGSLVALKDDELAATIIRMYNDSCAARAQESRGRINCMASLPYWDKALLVEETRRIVDLGIKGVTMPDRPERLSEGFIAPGGGVNPFWEETLEILEATGTPLNFHLNVSLDANSAIWDNLHFDQKLPITAILYHMATGVTMANFMISGILDRFPRLKIGLIESGAGWVPFFLEALDHQFNEFRVRENRRLQLSPKEYFQRNFWVSFWFESFAPKHMVEEIGVDRLLFETDFPHPTSLYPGVQDKLVEVMADHDHATRKRILEQNAVALYNLEF